MPPAASRLPQVVLAVLVLVGAALRVWQARESLWLDELHTAWCALGSLAEVAPRAMIGNQSPLFFWFEWLLVQGFGPSELRAVLYDLPYPSKDRPRSVEPCPLSSRELEVLKRLAQGMVYKQIALELSLSTSTVRTHLHNIYGKLGAVDRAQAVLYATERGWL